MQDKIIVTPSEVRGLGNIVSEKELEDFLVYMSTITSTSEEVDGITRKVYALGYVPPQVSLTLTLDKTVLDYDERTTLTATLLDENNTGIAGEEIKFYNENSYLFYTGTTDSNGVITINNVYSHQPGQHTYTGVLTSNTDITGSVTVTINKITSNISLSASSSSITYGNSVTLSGTLSAGSGKSVKIYNGNSLVDTVTTGSGGAFTKSVSGLNVGSHSFTAVYDGDNVYTDVTSSVVSVNVIAPSYDDIVVSADKQILSYADSEKATLYAQLQDNGSDAAVSGVTITFKQGNTTLGTAQTDNTGKATLVDGYTSAGVGDVTITATDGIILIQTYAVYDYYYYDSGLSDKSSHYTIPSNIALTHDTDHYHLVSSAENQFLSLINGKDNIEVKFKAQLNTQYGGVSIADSLAFYNNATMQWGASALNYFNHNNGSYGSQGSTSYSTDSTKYYDITITIQGSSIYFNISLNGTTVSDKTISKSLTNKYVCIIMWSNAVMNIKEIKVKPL